MPCKNKTNNGIIAIDGPAGSGKSTVAKGLAKRFGFLYVDTGAIYRALTLAAVKEKIDFRDKEALAKLAARVNIQLNMRGDSLRIALDGKDVSRAIREQSLTEKVCCVAAIRGVRDELVKMQRKLAKKAKGAVLEGRDIGTVVFPEAKYKFYLDARPDERVKRRFKELRQMGQKVRAEGIAEDIEKRDKSDMTRKIAPLARARDAVYIDTTELSINDVVEQISSVVGKSRCSI